jgi:hypothetical protein
MIALKFAFAVLYSNRAAHQLDRAVSIEVGLHLRRHSNMNVLEIVHLKCMISTKPIIQMAKNIGTFREDVGERVVPGYVVHPGDVTLPLGEGTTAIPFAVL